MIGITSISGNLGYGLLGSSHVRVEVAVQRPASASRDLNSDRATFADLLKVRDLRDAISAINLKHLTFTRRTGTAAVYASATSAAAADFEAQGVTTLRSTEEVNTAATSYSPFVPC